MAEADAAQAADRNGARRRRAPRMAEIVADALREDILAGRLTEVPRLEDLVTTYDVGPPAAREAMRILETEGLISVRRGNVGGADVHLPTTDRVAYMLSLVLQTSDTDLSDVAGALRELEPLCARLCAERKDRRRTVVPRLRALVKEQARLLGDVQATLKVVDEFHGALVQGCGNETLIQVVGALEHIWWAGHAEEVYGDEAVAPAEPEVWQAALRAHERIVEAIAAGDPDVARLAREHLRASQDHLAAVDEDRRVSAAAVAAAR